MFIYRVHLIVKHYPNFGTQNCIKPMQRILLLTIVSSLLIGCNKDKAAENTTTLSGQVVNPALDYIVLAQEGHAMDTVFLDAQNRFSHTFETEKLGLFNLIHNERQLVHVEKGDQILVRVNTVEFDESLSFSGKGGERSNFLADMFLLWEKENEGFTEHYQQKPQEFQQFLDSLQEVRNSKLEDFLANNDVSDSFKEIATAAVHLDNYQRKESYPFSHFVRDKYQFMQELPEDFYSFRESIDLNNPNLFDLYAYQRYLNAFIDNQAFLAYGNSEPYNTVSYTHNYNEIEVIQKHITNKKLKDEKLFRIARIFLANSNDKDGVEQIFTHLHANISNPRFKNRVEGLYADHKKMEAGNRIPDLMLIQPNPERKVTLSSRLNKPTVIYFWSFNNQMHMEKSHKKVEEYSKKYPEFNFLGINLNQKSTLWQRHLDKHQFSTLNEYRFDNVRDSRRKLVINDLSKTIVVDKNGIILNSHSNLHRATFENELLAYLNQ